MLTQTSTGWCGAGVSCRKNRTFREVLMKDIKHGETLSRSSVVALSVNS